MKKLLLFFAISLVFVSRAFATDYVGDLVIEIAGAEPATSPNTTIIIEETDAVNSLYSLSIKDFKFGALNIGDINLKDVKGEKQEDGSVLLTTENQKVTVAKVLTASVTLNGFLSADGKSFKTEVLEIEVTKMGIKIASVTASFSGTTTTALPAITAPDGADEVFDLAGKRVYSIDRRGIYIVRHADGTTSKIVKR